MVFAKDGGDRLGHLEQLVNDLSGVADANATHFDAMAQETAEVIVDGDGHGATKECWQEVVTDGCFDQHNVLCNARDNVVDVLPFGLEAHRNSCVCCLQEAGGDLHQDANTVNPLYNHGHETFLPSHSRPNEPAHVLLSAGASD